MTTVYSFAVVSSTDSIKEQSTPQEGTMEMKTPFVHYIIEPDRVVGITSAGVVVPVDAWEIVDNTQDHELSEALEMAMAARAVSEVFDDDLYGDSHAA